MSSVTPRRRDGRGRPENYVPFNPRPMEVGTRTGMKMPTNVPINDDGFEDPDEFFKSPVEQPRRNASKHTPRRGDGNTTPSPHKSRLTLRKRRSLAMDSDEEHRLPDDILGDDDEGTYLNSPQIVHRSSPNPPPSVRRSQPDPDSPPGLFSSPGLGSPSNNRKGMDVVTPSSARLSKSTKSTRAVVSPINGSTRTVAQLQSPVSLDGSLPPAGDLSVLIQEDEEHIEIEQELGNEQADDELPEDEPFDDDEDSQPVRRRSNGRGAGPVIATDEDEGAENSIDEDGNDLQLGDHDEGLEVDDDLERRAVEAEEGGDSGGEFSPQPTKQKRGRGRPPKHPRESPLREVKRKRVSQLPAEGDHQYKGDFKTRHSSRQHIAPLKYWKNEKIEYRRGVNGPEWDAVVRVPDDTPQRLGTHPRAQRRKLKRSQSRSMTPDDDLEGLDANTLPIQCVIDVDAGGEVDRRVAMPRHLLQPRAVLGGQFMYQKVFGEDRFMASGVIVLPRNTGTKPSKPTKDNSYSFFVHSGAVNVTIHRSMFLICAGGLFMIPRGNTYKLTNALVDKEAHLFFSQSRKVLVAEMEADDDAELEDYERVGSVDPARVKLVRKMPGMNGSTSKSAKGKGREEPLPDGHPYTLEYEEEGESEQEAVEEEQEEERPAPRPKPKAKAPRVSAASDGLPRKPRGRPPKDPIARAAWDAQRDAAEAASPQNAKRRTSTTARKIKVT